MAGSLQYMMVDDFYTEYLKRNYDHLDKLEVIIVSKDIISDQKTMVNSKSVYHSRYKNVDFAMDIFPNPSVEEYLYGATLEAFGQKYKTQLEGVEQMTTLCSIVDLVINEGYDIVLICSRVEMKMNYFHYMKEYIFENFGVIMNDYSEQLMNDDDSYVHDYGDFEKARKLLQFQLEHTKLIDETLGTFFNKFTSDMAKEYREILMTKSVDELFVIGTKRGIHVNRHKPKDYIVDHILAKMLETSTDPELPWT